MERLVWFGTRLRHDTDGQDMVEYAFLLGMLSVSLLTLMWVASGSINAIWVAAYSALISAANGI